jgi:hypothetical protein
MLNGMIKLMSCRHKGRTYQPDSGAMIPQKRKIQKIIFTRAACKAAF